jgi:Holliday junction resolvasome RuvABC DNA-binding subunit
MQPIKHSDWRWFVSIPLQNRKTAERYAAEMREEYEEVEVEPRLNEFVVKYRGRKSCFETSKS